MATRGSRRHGSTLSPTAAAAPICAGPIRVPGASSRSPRFTSLPARRTNAPGFASSGTWSSSSSTITRSIGTIASAPGGTTAPVEMAIASPGPRAPSDGDAGGGLPDDPQAPGGVAGADGVAVHRRVGEWRQVDAGVQRLGEESPVALVERHRLDAERRDLGGDDRERVVDREELSR